MNSPKEKIVRFKGEYRWLSNFWLSPIMFEDLEYPTVENAYQAAKTKGDRKLFSRCSPRLAKEEGRKVNLREDWDNVKLLVMYELLEYKFLKNTFLAKKLIDTNDIELIEGNTWGDIFWGVCNGKGENHLGRILMDIRKTLKEGNK